jgi:Ca2+-dependent lipid-binding protein
MLKEDEVINAFYECDQSWTKELTTKFRKPLELLKDIAFSKHTYLKAVAAGALTVAAGALTLGTGALAVSGVNAKYIGIASKAILSALSVVPPILIGLTLFGAYWAGDAAYKKENTEQTKKDVDKYLEASQKETHTWLNHLIAEYEEFFIAFLQEKGLKNT